MDVTREALEQQLRRLEHACERRDEGLFGPGSTFWKVQRHAVLFAGAGRATLLQLAHPFVARAIAEHSPVAADPLGRFRRTFRWVFPMIFGDRDAALRAARIVHARHRMVSGRFVEPVGPYVAGSCYRATDPAATRWVHATLCDTSIRMYEAFVAPLSLREKETYYEESRRFAALFGCEPELLPADWEAFEQYNRAMWSSPLLAVSEEARALAHRLFRPRSAPARALLVPYEAWTAQWLPQRLRDAFGLPPRPGPTAAWFDCAFRSERYWPPAVRYLPVYHEALARVGRRPAVPLVSRGIQRLAFGAAERSTPALQTR